MISEAELIDSVERLKPAIEKYKRDSKHDELSFFEVYTALALVYFKEKKIDFAVLETGLGGRLDATNVVNSLVCALAPISYEHTQKLGNSLRQIATEKAGIIKSPRHRNWLVRQELWRKNQKLIVISAPQEKEALEVIQQRCREVGAKLYALNRDIFYEKRLQGFDVTGIFGEYPNLEITLQGEHQLINATVAVAVIEALRFYDIYIGIDSIRDGLYNTIWPGRCEVVSKEPWVVLDGAQNIASSRALKETIKENFQYERLILVLGISKDKDIKGICHELSDLADRVILTQADNPRAVEPEYLTGYFNGKKIYIAHNLKEAKIKARAIAKEKDLILVTGSLFVVGESRTLFKSAG